MNPKQFLQIGGAVLVVVGVLGFVGVIGPTPEASILGEAWWFDNGENWAHTVLGLIAIAASLALGADLQRLLVRVLGIVSVLVGLYSLVIGPGFLGANLENPLDTLLHLAVGAWALMASKSKKGAMMQ